MSPANTNIEACVRDSLLRYFEDLGGEAPEDMYEMLLRLVEKPLLEVVMHHAGHNQSCGRVAGPEPQHAAQEAGRSPADLMTHY